MKLQVYGNMPNETWNLIEDVLDERRLLAKVTETVLGIIVSGNHDGAVVVQEALAHNGGGFVFVLVDPLMPFSGDRRRAFQRAGVLPDHFYQTPQNARQARTVVASIVACLDRIWAA